MSAEASLAQVANDYEDEIALMCVSENDMVRRDDGAESAIDSGEESPTQEAGELEIEELALLSSQEINIDVSHECCVDSGA